MKIRTPIETLGECCWLPRLIDKSRLQCSGDLPWSYRIALGSPLGIDTYFLRHFQISQNDFFACITQSQGDDLIVATLFLQRPSVNLNSIAVWNRLGHNLGMPGFPGYWTFHIVKWVLYPRAVKQPVSNLFKAIMQDESGDVEKIKK